MTGIDVGRDLSNFLSRVLADPRTYDDDVWDRAHVDHAGVIALDPVGHMIGWRTAAGKYSVMSRFKQPLVGVVKNYGTHDESGAEFDWNIFVAPDAPFRYVHDDVALLMDRDDRVELRQFDHAYCVEAEITPDENYYDSIYFGIDPERSRLVGKRIGVYGPWVRDHGHGGKPEIHPCELVWWHENNAHQNGLWTALIIQDDSNRFDRVTDYSAENYDGSLEPVSPAVIRHIEHPWSGPPRHALLMFAVQLVKGRSHRFRLTLRRHRNVKVRVGPTTTTNPNAYVVTAPPQVGPTLPIVRIEVDKVIDHDVDVDAAHGDQAEPAGGRNSPGKLDAWISSIVPGADDRELRCFVGTRIELGVNDRGREGYAEVLLEDIGSTKLIPSIGEVR